ncbi:MAG: RNA 2',3'-cyclic phosphodiesterase [Acidobacteria bacterium]|nr:RNA 2',3'-cyclic phosphodiesterase [Acidobacteriota bacterium]
MRLFVAAELPVEVRRRIAGIVEVLEAAPLRVRWVRPEGIHLTFKFLGEVDPGRLADIKGALLQAGEGISTFRLRAAGVGAFPGRGAPRVIWVGVEGEIEMAGRLQEALERSLQAIGFPREERPFRPHLTLGRVKGPARGDWRPALARASEEAPGAFEVSEFALFESRLDRHGLTHSVLARFPLSPGGGP